VIDTDEHLRTFLERAAGATWLALDTEADSLHAYPEKVCLLQVSLEGSDLLIDPLARLDLQPLWPALHRHEILMHGSDYDLRLLRKNYQFVPARIFDTMLAARLLGLPEFGLGHLVQKFLGVTLEKGSQKADWARRPLTPKMESYARNDTHYLKPLSDLLRAELLAKGRLPWLEESCARLIADCSTTPVVDQDAVWRIRGSHQLGRPALAVLRELWRWRESEAVRHNKPPYFILSHETMVALAERAPDPQAVDAIMPRHHSPARRQNIEQALRRGLQTPEEEYPHHIRIIAQRLTEADRRRVDELKKIRDQRATELAIDPTLIASKSMLFSLARDWSTHQSELMNWQRDLLQSGNS
jgi:ribonuclease D